VLQAVELEAGRSRRLQDQARLVLEAKLGALGSLVAGISRDVNTPVGTVRTNADSLGKGLARIRAPSRPDVVGSTW